MTSGYQLNTRTYIRVTMVLTADTRCFVARFLPAINGLQKLLNESGDHESRIKLIYSMIFDYL